MSQLQSICISFSSTFPSKTKRHHQLLHDHLAPSPLPKLTHQSIINRRGVVLPAASSENLTPLIEEKYGPHQSDQSAPLVSAADVVREFYDGINSHDLASVEDLIAQNCVYEDLVFPSPFVGRKTILDFFGKFIDYVSTDLQFVIDAISEEDSSAVGVTWHLEWKGRPFPFSKGCSFYQLQVVNGIRQIIYARDSVEPAIKPGESALVAIRGVTWLLQRFPTLADRL